MTLLLLAIVVGSLALSGLGLKAIYPIIDDAETELLPKPDQTKTPQVAPQQIASSVPEKSLFASKNTFGNSLKKLFSSSERTLDAILPELEETLLLADVGVSATEKLVENLRANSSLKTSEDFLQAIKNEMIATLTPKKEFVLGREATPHVIYFVGVNGVGKTTTIGKLANQYKAAGKNVLLVAADTFRAAAVEQLKIWAERNAVECIAGASGADPASVIVDGLRAGKARAADVILVDTAGRLHNKVNLMDELRKMARMCEKVLERPADDIFLVVDSVTGQNGFNQARVFMEAVPLTGVVLTKYDSTSKGGIILSIASETGLPVRYLGLGEQIEDLKKFDAREFVDRIFS